MKIKYFENLYQQHVKSFKSLIIFFIEKHVNDNLITY